MVNYKRLNRTIASEKVDLIFYLVISKNGKRMLKPLGLNTKISLALVKAILDNTVIDSFYDTLSKDLINRGVAPGSRVQLRAKFNETHTMMNSALKGVKVLCEVNV